MGINKNVLSNEYKEFLRGIGYSANTVNTFHGFINVFSEKQTITVEKVKEKIVLNYLNIKLFKGDASENKKGRIVSAFEYFFNDMHERGFNPNKYIKANNTFTLMSNVLSKISLIS